MPEAPTIYIPDGCYTLDKQSEPQYRILIQGFPKTGKTSSCVGYKEGTGFPNPIVLNPDRGLVRYGGRKDIVDIPIWSPEYCKKINPQHNSRFNLKDTILIWFNKEAPKLTENQTLIIDGGTGFQGAYHKWYSANRVVTASGEVDAFAQWRLKIDYFSDICEPLKQLKCNVIFIFHESEKKEKGGEYKGKIRPLLTGQFQDELGGHFTDVFRQLTKEKPRDYTKVLPETLTGFRMTVKEYEEMAKGFEGDTIYYWQTTSDDIFDGGSGSLDNPPKFIPATYASFCKYRKKIS